MTTAMDVPESTVAVVLLSHGEDGALLAQYLESRNRVPAPLSQVAEALLSLAMKLDTMRADLSEAESRSGDTPPGN